MRYRELLREYRRDITGRNYGAKLLDALLHDQLWNIYDVLAQALPDEILPAIDAAHEQVVQQSKNSAYAQIIRDNAQTIIDYMLSRFEDVDPTPNKSYTEWLARTYANSRRYNRRQFLFEDVVSTVAGYLRKFVDYSARRLLQLPNNDINRYRTFNDFMNAIDRVSASAKTDKDSIKNRGSSTEFYVDDTVRVIVPHDEEASIYYGQGTRWCTAATTSTNYFDRYNSEGPLYILIPKQPKHQGEKYQIHIVTRADDSAELAEFMDERNDFVDTALLPRRFPEFYKKFAKKYPEITELAALSDSATLLNVYRATCSAVIKQITALKNYYNGMSDELEDSYAFAEEACDETLQNLNRMQDYDASQLRNSIRKFEEFEAVNLHITLLNDFIAYECYPNMVDDEYAVIISTVIRDYVTIYRLSDGLTPQSINARWNKKSDYQIIDSNIVDGYYIIALARKEK